MLDPDEQSWAIDDHFPILNEEQISNKVGVEHQPDMMLWSWSSLFIPDHQHNRADFLYNSCWRWSFHLFLVCLYQIATLEKMLTFSPTGCYTPKNTTIAMARSTLVDGKTLQSFLIHAIILSILHGKTIPKPRFFWDGTWSEKLPCPRWVNKKTPRVVHWLCIYRASHGAYVECMYMYKSRINSLCYLTYHNLPSLKPT